jgi:RNA polymerase sigma-70 factor (ECF subfamily)
MALEPMKDPAAGAALRAAQPKLKGKLLVGVIGSIGVRRDPEAWKELAAGWEAVRPELVGYLTRLVTRQDVAEELAQEAAARMLEAESAPRAAAGLRAWLFRVATNLAISRGRRTQTMLRHLPQLALLRHAASPERQVLEAERDEALRTALGSLPLETRAAIVLASNGFTAREIGAALGRSEGAVRMLVSRGRLRLRRLMAAADVERSTEAS